MTEFSRPWAGTTVGDAGPYTAKDWWDVWQHMQKASGRLTLSTFNGGVYYACAAGKLAGSVPGANTFRISAGAALVDGTFYYNDANVDVNVPSATVGNVRNDRIVLRKSFNTAIQTVRIVRVAGGQAASPGPGTPTALVKDTTGVTYWDVPLYQVKVTDAGVVTAYADERVYLDVEPKYLFVPFELGHNITDNVELLLSMFDYGLNFPPDKVAATNVKFVVPADFVTDMYTSVLVISSQSPADVVLVMTRELLKAGVTIPASSDNIGATTVTYVDNSKTQVMLYTIYDAATPAPGDVCVATFNRSGSAGADTMIVDLTVVGLIVNYMGWR